MIFVELEKVLKKDGWCYYGEGKLHIQYKHKEKNGIITIPKHRGEIKKEVLNTILQQIKIDLK